MTNDVTLLLAIVVRAGLITKTEGEDLAKKLTESNIPSNYSDTYKLVDSLFSKLGIGEEKHFEEVEVDGKKITVSKNFKSEK